MIVTVLLTILKVIGWILLIALLLILGLLLLILFCPFCYRIRGDLVKKILDSGGDVEVSWLFGLIGGGGRWEDKQLKIYIRIARYRKVLKTLFGKEEEPEQDDEPFTLELPGDESEDTESEDTESEDREAENTESEDREAENTESEDREAEVTQAHKPESAGNLPADKPLADMVTADGEAVRTLPAREASAESQKEEQTEEPAVSEETGGRKPEKAADPGPGGLPGKQKPEKKKKSRRKPAADHTQSADLKEKILAVLQKAEEVLQMVMDAVGSTPEKAQQVMEKIWSLEDLVDQKYDLVMSYVGDPVNQAAVLHILKEVKKILFGILPKHMKADLSYSAGSPDLTGQILGLLAILPVVHKDRWEIRPDFETETFYAEGRVTIRGKLCIYKIVGALIVLLLDRNVRKLIKRVLKLVRNKRREN